MRDPTARFAAAIAERYRIERRLGEGGMATVYLAHDPRHDRNVAVKVLRPELAAVLGAERFIQEIRTTANLQHPHILPLFDSGEAGSFLYYVMPYVEGESLRQRLDRETQLGVSEAVHITCDVADALDYAHRHGVVHRDIKPENILLHDGRPMVADFGIALAVSAAAGGRMTETGLSLGTPHYMSPEQATADKHIGPRSDIYSLGCVLYEMLAGNPPHTGSSAQQIIMKIVAEQATPVSSLRPAVPANVAAAVGQALAKVPADRFETARGFADALTNPHFATSRTRAPSVAAPHPTRRNARTAIVTGVSLAAIAIALWGWLRPTAARPVARYAITLRRGTPLAGPLVRLAAAISPDGSAIVYEDVVNGQEQLFLKRRQDAAGQPLAGTEEAIDPFFSPDGAWIAFFRRGELLKMPAAGGNVVPVADSAYAVRPVSGAWLDDGTILFTDVSFRLRRVTDVGGPARVAVRLPAPWLVSVFLSALPGGRGVLFTACNAFCGRSAAYVWDARRDSIRLLVNDVAGIEYASTGDVLYVTRDGTLEAARWDNNNLRIAGPAVPVLHGLGSPGLALSRSGTALYRLGGPVVIGPGPTASIPDAEAVWVDRTGRVEPVDTAWRFDPGTLGGAHLALSPDGTRLAIGLRTDLGYDIWVKQLPRGAVSRLTFFPGEDGNPSWTPDGRRITFSSERPPPSGARGTTRYALWSRAADGSGDATLLWRGPQDLRAGVWSPDGKWLLLQTGPGVLDILAARPGVDSVARPLVATKYDEQAPALSPDGRWLAYVSDRTGTKQVYVSPFPETQRGEWQVSAGEGGSPLWAHHGHELFYWAGDTLMSAEIAPGPPFSVAKRRAMFMRPAGVLMQGAASTYPVRGGMMDITPDDRRFIMVRALRAAATAPQGTLVLEENFLQELRAKVGK